MERKIRKFKRSYKKQKRGEYAEDIKLGMRETIGTKKKMVSLVWEVPLVAYLFVRTNFS